MTDNDEANEKKDHNPVEEVGNEEDDEKTLLAFMEAKKNYEEMQRKIDERGIKEKAQQTVQENDDDVNMILVEEKVDVSFLDGGYDWRIHVTEILQVMANGNDKDDQVVQPQVVLPYDLFNTQLGIRESMAIKYCEYLGIEPITDHAIAIKLSYIEILKKSLSKTIINIINKFWFDIANKLGLYHGNNNEKVYDSKTLRLAIQQCKKFSQCKKLMTLFYLVFDHKNLMNYQKKIADHVEKIHNIKFVVPVKDDPSKRAKQHCLISLVSHEINTQRNTLVNHALATLNLKFQLKRVTGTFNKEDPKRKKLYLYPYMIKGNLVSRLFCFMKSIHI